MALSTYSCLGMQLCPHLMYCHYTCRVLDSTPFLPSVL